MKRPSLFPVSLILLPALAISAVFAVPAGATELMETSSYDDAMPEMNWEGESSAQENIALQQELLNNQWAAEEPAEETSTSVTTTQTLSESVTEEPPVDRDPPLTPEQEAAADLALQEADQLLAEVDSFLTAGATAEAGGTVAEAQTAPADGDIRQLEESLGLQPVTPYEQLRDEIMDSIIDLRQKKESLAAANTALRTAQTAYATARTTETDAFEQVEADYQRWLEARNAEGLITDVGSEIGLIDRPSDALFSVLTASRERLRQARAAADAASTALLGATTNALSATLDTSSARRRAQEALDRALDEYFLPQYSNLSARLAANRLAEQQGQELPYSYEALFNEFTGINNIFEAFIYWHDGYFAGDAMDEVRQEIDLLNQAFHPTEHPLGDEAENPLGDDLTTL